MYSRTYPVASIVPDLKPDPSLPSLRDITNTAWDTSYLSRSDARFALESAVAAQIKPVLSSKSYYNTQSRLSSDPLITKSLYGPTPSELNDSTSLASLTHIPRSTLPNGLLANSPSSQTPLSTMQVPPIKRLIIDSAKLARLDDLLKELKAGGHRILLYFQMTRMMDLVEEYLIYRQYKYLRLDGGTSIGDRRDLVTSWQTKSVFSWTFGTYLKLTRG
jgi:SNF2 family DNA or RNA helicase